MEEKLNFIQEKLIKNIERLDSEEKNVESEIARSNAMSQLANTYIKSCNLIIRVNESEKKIKSTLSRMNNEK